MERERLACSVVVFFREMEGNIDPSSSVYAGGGGLLRSTVADFSFREGEFPSAPPSPAFSYGEWRLAKLRAAA